MAKGARASSIKANNSKLKSKVFGPVENARTERLSAKLLELASQPKPKPEKKDESMEVQEDATENNIAPEQETKQSEEMEVDQDATKTVVRSKSSKGRIEKRRRTRKASIVFPKYRDGRKTGRSQGKK